MISGNKTTIDGLYISLLRKKDQMKQQQERLSTAAQQTASNLQNQNHHLKKRIQIPYFQVCFAYRNTKALQQWVLFVSLTNQNYQSSRVVLCCGFQTLFFDEGLVFRTVVRCRGTPTALVENDHDEAGTEREDTLGEEIEEGCFDSSV